MDSSNAKTQEQLLTKLNQEKRWAEALNRVSTVLTSTLNLNEVVDRILTQIAAVFPNDAANVMLIDGDIARVFRGYGYERFGTQQKLDVIELNVPKVEALQAMRTHKEPLVIPHVDGYEKWVYAIPEHRWIQSYVGVPMIIRDQVIGFLNVNSATPNFFDPSSGARLQSFANHAAIAIENARLYQTLQRQNDNLENLVAHRTAELQERNFELDAFAHTVAHELKGPISSLVGASDLLSEDIDTMPSHIIMELANNVKLISLTMSSVVDELLLLSSVRQDELPSDIIYMTTIIDKVQTRLTHMLKRFNGQLILPPRWPVVRGYAPWVEEIWVNYISNGLKYGGESPRLILGANPQPDNTVRFWVQDNGPGIASKDQRALFSEFTRLENIHIKGHSLGLSIVKRIANKLGGEVGVESDVGQGSTFFFTLPTT